jgi:uncharacterized protein with HEPN domain
MIPARTKIFKQYRGDLQPTVLWDVVKDKLPKLPMFQANFLKQ